jgi:hypothetical protein
MKILAILFLSLSFVISYAQAPEFNGRTWEAPYHLSSPANWGVERFPIPIGFAPQIPYKGVEDIRFTPGWAKAASDEFWSYAFLWYLEGDVKTDAKIIENNLQQYYHGLITANGIDTSNAVITTFKEIAKDTHDVKTFNGTIQMFDYMAKQTIVINCKVHVKICKNKTKTFIFYELSPKPLSHIVWQSLDALWTDFKCKK